MVFSHSSWEILLYGRSFFDTLSRTTRVLYSGPFNTLFVWGGGVCSLFGRIDSHTFRIFIKILTSGAGRYTHILQITLNF